MQWYDRRVGALAVVALCYFALVLSNEGFQSVLDFRILERTPLTTIHGAAGGESQLQGRVEPSDEVLTSPRTNTKSVYYRHLVQKEHRNSEGGTSWRTIKDESRAVDFHLIDASGNANIRAKHQRNLINWSVHQSYQQQSGRIRHTEWRIEPGQQITVFGWLHVNSELPTVTFDEIGDYLSIISSFTGASERSELSANAIFLLWGGVSFLVLMCCALAFTLGLHRVLAFLGLITVASSTLLISYGFKSLESDIQAGYDRVDSQLKRTEDQITSVLENHKITFPGWQLPFNLSNPEYAALTDLEKEKINNWRSTAYLVRSRYMRQINRFPEKPYAIMRGKAKPPVIALPADQQRIADQAVQAYLPTRVGQQLILTFVALVSIAILAWLAFRLIKVKRMQENLPTSKTMGVVFGLTELKGKLVAEDEGACLIGPVSGFACTWYHYEIQEERGSGKRSSWHTIHEETQKQPFYCEDDEGKLRVFPSKAEIITKHKSTNHFGKKRYIERRLQPGDDLYLLGKAKADKTTGNSLVLSHDKEAPYIISNRSEAEVMFIKASKAMLLLSLGTSLLFGVGLWIGGSNGNFSSADFVTASLIAPLFLTIFLVVLMYNDLIFLRQRCARNWANIDVSLKKRATLIPNLERVVKRYLEHENGLQQALAQLRTERAQVENVNAADAYMAHESRVIDKLSLCLEKYPDLEGHQVVTDFNRRLIKLENEIALIRAGFNDSVMNFNTRLQSFPDNLLAIAFKFERLTALQFDKKAHQLPAVDLQQKNS